MSQENISDSYTVTFKKQTKQMNKVIKNINYFILLCLLMIPSLAFSQGSRYTGSYKKSAPIKLKNQNNIVIEGLEISATNQYCIVLWGGENITIKNCKFISAPNTRAVYISGCKNVTLVDCYFENVYEGVAAQLCSGNIKIEHNDFKNIRGQLDGGSYFANAIRFDRVTGAGNSISYNAIENIKGESSPEDNIALYASHGTPQSPIIVKGNWIRGGGPNHSGGGVNLGDMGGSYQIAEDNILVNPGQVGMGMAGGNNLTIRNNKIYAKQQPFTNVGLAIVNWTVSKTGPSHNIVVENNEINWTNKDGKYNTAWFSTDMRSIVKDWYNQGIRNPNINESILPKVIIGRAKNSGNNTPPVTQPDNNTPNSPITEVYIDNFKRVAVKYLAFPIPLAHAEGYSSSGQLLVSMPLPRYNQAFPVSVPKGDYYIKITYPDLGKEEITKITIN